MLKLMWVLTFVHHFEFISSTYNYTKRCFISDDANPPVVWNVTFTAHNETPPPDMSNADVVMQTKNYHSPNAWKTLNRCNRTAYSMQCRIDDNSERVQYFFRVVRHTNSSHSENLIPETAKGNYQDGLLCYSAHGVRNLRHVDITAHSVTLRWSFYTWDIKNHILLRFRWDVHHEGKLISHNQKRATGQTSVNQSHTVSGLDAYTSYKFTVTNVYDSEQKRSEFLSVKTSCTSSGPTFNSAEFGVIFLSCLLLTFAVLISVYLFRVRRRERLRRLPDLSIVDLRDLGVADNITDNLVLYD